MKPLEFTVFPSDLGWQCLVWRAERLCELTFGHRTPRSAVSALRSSVSSRDGHATPAVAAWIVRLQNYAAGDHHDDFQDVELDLEHLTAFQRCVVQCCREIPAGEIVTYGQLAVRAGYPQAARAVGQVMATNRFPLVVPCHRVVAAGGLMGGYSAPEGLTMKKRLLAAEGVTQFRHQRRSLTSSLFP